MVSGASQIVEIPLQNEQSLHDLPENEDLVRSSYPDITERLRLIRVANLMLERKNQTVALDQRNIAGTELSKFESDYIL